MKFACDKCNTKYSIADERVRGRVLKIRCKACNHVITVREESPAVADMPDEHTMVSTAPPPARDDAPDEWFISFDGEQEGPLPLVRAIDRVRSERPTGKECFCWRAGFFVWLPVEDVPDFAPAIAPPKPLPPPPLPASVRATGSHAAVRSPSGSLPAVGKSPTGSQPAVKSTTGSQAAVKSPSGSVPALRSGSGSMAAVGKSTAANPAVGKATGSNPAVGGASARPNPFAPSNATPGSGSPAVGKSTGSHAAVKPSSGAHPRVPMAAPAFDLPGFDSGPLGTGGAPSASLPGMPTKPEPRLARRDDAGAKAEAKSQPALEPADSGPNRVSPFAAALAAGGGAAHADGGDANVPKADARPLDTGPVPLPPPPGDDLPIGEASGLISLAHLAKAPSPMSKPASSHAKSLETFGGVPVTPSSAPFPSPIVAAAGAAPGSAPSWMKWAAIAGGVMTIGLAVVVGILLTRKPTVIVVPPAPSVEQKSTGDNPILIADPGPNPTGAAPATPGTAEEPSKHGGGKQQHARAGKPPTKAPGDEKGLSGEQNKLAALYGRDETEHAVPVGGHTERGGGGGNVSQQAIMAVVTQNRRSLNLCYDRVLKRDPSLKSGRVVTHVKIGISGSVTGVSVPDPQYSSSEIGQCIAQTIKRWHFPSSDAEYETEFPIILQAN
jgi:predicted Zn finger-like uncharacterized protein